MNHFKKRVKQNTNILQGKVIICTYPKTGQDELAEMLTAQGASVFSMPVIEISPLPFQLQTNLNDYDWLIFTSKNAVEPFTSRYPSIPCKVAALGEKTAIHLRKYQVDPAFIGSGKSAVDFATQFIDVVQVNEKILLVLGNLAPDTLKQKLGSKASIDRINAYQTCSSEQLDPRFMEWVEHDRYDLLLVTSPSSVRAILEKVSKSADQLRFVSIGTTTTAAIRKYGGEPVATSEEPSYEGMAQTIIDYYQAKIKN
ncbi:uroporphyrinogen-III synthase [Sunxiuqinia rutila]|uniref:uroporphyrinogen-III synthase n=1 Tax=Sunxiuqinia rutila TaxID=1397841 RepID=UPI003D35D95D